MLWRFDEFVHGEDRGIISHDMPKGAEAEFYVLLTEHLGLKRANEWREPSYKPLGGGLGEIRFKESGLAYRVYSGFAPGLVCRLWMWATKSRTQKGHQKTQPPDAIETARARKDAYENRGIGRLKKYVPKD